MIPSVTIKTDTKERSAAHALNTNAAAADLSYNIGNISFEDISGVSTKVITTSDTLIIL